MLVAHIVEQHVPKLFPSQMDLVIFSDSYFWFFFAVPNSEHSIRSILAGRKRTYNEMCSGVNYRGLDNVSIPVFFCFSSVGIKKNCYV